LLIGGVVVGATSSFVSQGIENDWNFEEFNAGLIISDTIFGAVDGLLAATGIGFLGSLVLDAGITFAQSVTTALIMHGEYTLQDVQKEFFTSLAFSCFGAGVGKFIDVKFAKGKWATNLDPDRLLGKWSSAMKTINSNQGPVKQARAAFNISYVKKSLAASISLHCGTSFVSGLF